MVVGKAGGKEHRLAPEGRRLAIDIEWRGLGLQGKCLAVKLGQRRIAMDVDDLFHQRAGQAVRAIDRPIGQRGNGTAQLAVAVGLGELARQALPLAELQLGKAVAQHEMGKIEVEGMRRHVRAFGHETEIAERAGLDD